MTPVQCRVKERRHWCRRAEGTTMKRALGTHAWAALPQPPQECSGSLAQMTPRATPPQPLCATFRWSDRTTGMSRRRCCLAFGIMSAIHSGWNQRGGATPRLAKMLVRNPRASGAPWRGAQAAELASLCGTNGPSLISLNSGSGRPCRGLPPARRCSRLARG